MNNGSSGGIGFSGTLQIVFIILKLCKVINWSWFWVLTPLWIDLVILAILIIPSSIEEWKWKHSREKRIRKMNERLWNDIKSRSKHEEVQDSDE